MAKTAWSEDGTNFPGLVVVCLNVRPARPVVAAVLTLVAASCTSEVASTTTTATGSATTTAVATTTTSAEPDLPACREGGPPRQGIDLEYEAFFDAYRHSAIDRLINLIGGDGPVYDPWLDPGNDGHFDDLASWVEAGNEATDRFINFGYGMNEPFQIYAIRRNETLDSMGIDGLSVTVDLWANQDCELRVEVHSPVASPDPCLLDEAFPDQGVDACEGPFLPTTWHHTVWTGDDVLMVGGRTGASETFPKVNAFLFDPAAAELRTTSTVPVDAGWYTTDVIWLENRAFVIGHPLYRESISDYRPTILTYSPEVDDWEVLTTFPEGRLAIGAVVWSGEDLIFVGGDQNLSDPSVRAYIQSTNEWTDLEAPMEPVEEARAVWTGEEVVIVGGYVHQGDGAGVMLAYNPTRDTWRDIAPLDLPWLLDHALIWTGDRVIVVAHQTWSSEAAAHSPPWLLIYDPESDEWTQSSEMPIEPTISGAATWTGSEVLIWGGRGGHGSSAEGAAYDPADNTWRVVAESPLAPRSAHSGTWTGEEWVIIGGTRDDSALTSASFSDGAIYDPEMDTWQYLDG